MYKTGKDYDVISSAVSMRGAGGLVGALTGKSQPVTGKLSSSLHVDVLLGKFKFDFAFAWYEISKDMN